MAIRFFGPIVTIVNRWEDRVSLPRHRISARELVELLCVKYGDKFREIAIHDGELNSGLVVSVNGEVVIDGSEELECGDQVQILIASQMRGG